MAPDYSPPTACHKSCWDRDALALARAVSSSPEDVCKPDSLHLSALGIAVTRGAVDCVRALLGEPVAGIEMPDLDVTTLVSWRRPQTNDTLLHVCVKAAASTSDPVDEETSVVIANLLVARGVPVDVKDVFGNTARSLVPSHAKALNTALFDPHKDIRVTFSG